MTFRMDRNRHRDDAFEHRLQPNAHGSLAEPDREQIRAGFRRRGRGGGTDNDSSSQLHDRHRHNDAPAAGASCPC